MNAEERIHDLELKIFKELCTTLSKSSAELLQTSRSLAEIDVLANDTDVENNDLVLVAGGFSALADGSGTVQHGTVDIRSGKVVFAPYDNWNGTAVFYYTVSDQQAENSTSRAKVTVTVRPVTCSLMLPT